MVISSPATITVTLQGSGVLVQPVIVEGGFGAVGAVRDPADGCARLGLGLVPDGVERALERIDAVAIDQLGDAVAAHHAAADL